MFKVAGVVWVALLGCAAAYPYPVTQEELAQYVARQQTAGLSGQQQVRRQAYLLQPQAKAVYQPQPKEQAYQTQYSPQQVTYQPQPSPKQYYTPQPQAQEPQQYYQPQPQPQVQQYYQSQPGPQPAKKLLRPLPGQQLKQEPEDYDPNPQYQFGFDINDDEFTNYQQRKEQRDGDKISGSYSVVDSDGYIRTVKYTADPLEGFKADVVREPTDIKIKFPVPAQSSPHLQQQNDYSGIAAAARKQQTQQYLTASKPQQILRPEHTQVYSPSQSQLRQLAAYTGASQVVASPQKSSPYSQQPQVFQSYQDQ
ncbi:Insect cuticle protein [Nesidiocoris tenuis]|uniref:Insect cuticle protein n=2 Tax=Nesidiocoris tenuis TaxID=355587 RepID=A0ABN7ALW2_9HEMI|nr:Insect cuticle protein [Nesidiocoris tenuis]